MQPTNAPSTARGRSRWGCALSPPTWSAPSKPMRAKTIPPLAMARRIDSAGPVPVWTKKPPPATKLCAWKLVVSRTSAVKVGTAILATVIVELALESHRMPSRFSVTNRPISTTAAR